MSLNGNRPHRPVPTTPLYHARRAAGLTQAALAAQVGVTQPHLSALERMTAQASPGLASRLRTALGGRISEEQILYPQRFVAAR